MAKLRKFCAYKRLERPYTRTSKYRKKAFIRARPHSKIVKFYMGNTSKKFDVTFDLISKNDLQIRHNAFESARLAANRHLEKNLGKTGFFLHLRQYPHHILRENPLASGAGADRMSTGMKMSFGKAIGVAAQIRKGTELFTVGVPKGQENTAKAALQKCASKLPCKCTIQQRQEEAPAVEKAGKKAEPKAAPEKPAESPAEPKAEEAKEAKEEKILEPKAEAAEEKKEVAEAESKTPVEGKSVEEKPAEAA